MNINCTSHSLRNSVSPRIVGHGLVAQVDLSAIVHNCSLIRQLIPPKCRLCVVVKCNAYGLGVDIVLPVLKSANVEMLAVATIDEASQVIELGWNRSVLILGSQFSTYQGKDKHQIADWIVENQIRITVVDASDIEALAAAAQRLGKEAIIHVMLDSGMSRMGLDEQSLLSLIDKAGDSAHITIEGLYTHLASADEHDKSYADYQLQRFKSFIENLEKDRLHIPIIHAANSAATMDLPESHFDMVRVGISIYGYHPSQQIQHKPDLKPAMRLVSCLNLVKRVTAGSSIGYGRTYRAADDMLIGLVPIGYADGYDRKLSNQATMTVVDHLVGVVGRVSMDQTLIDLSSLTADGIEVSVGQEVIVIDNIAGMPNSVESLADQLGTIPYEIITRLGPRIVRVPL